MKYIGIGFALAFGWHWAPYLRDRLITHSASTQRRVTGTKSTERNKDKQEKSMVSNLRWLRIKLASNIKQGFGLYTGPFLFLESVLTLPSIVIF